MFRHKLLVIALSFCSALPVCAQQCGGEERWPVKVGSDSNAGTVNLANLVTATIHELVSKPRPQLPSDDDTRLSQETTVYVVSGRLLKFKLESGRTGDMDYHLVVTDDTLQFSPGGSGTTPSPHSLVAEIVKPECIPGRNGSPTTQSRFQNQIADVRAKFEQQFPHITGGWNDAGGIPVVITGVGFFDRQHGQTGRALNGIEIHPILDISFNGGGTPPIPPVTVSLQNPGFESGPQSWTATPGVISNDSSEPSRTGIWKAWLGGYGVPHTDTLFQQVSIPSTASTVTLSFYLHISTEEQTTTQQYDTLKVQVLDNNGQLLQTLATYSNLLASPGFQLRTLNLNQFRGQTIRLHFVAKEDNGSMTSFVLDDFVLTVE